MPGTVCPNRCDDLSRPRGPVSIPGQAVHLRGFLHGFM